MTDYRSQANKSPLSLGSVMDFSWSDSDLEFDELEAMAEAVEIEGMDEEEVEELMDDPMEVEEVERPVRNFRLNAKNLFLTYPQCEEHPEFLIEQCREYWGDDLEWVVCGREQHQDGNDHLHVVIGLKKKVNLRQADCLDFLAGKHGDYRSMGSKKKALEYATKDGDFEEFGIDVANYLEAQRTHKTQQSVEVAQGVMNGDDLATLNGRFPGFFLMNLPRIQTYQSWYEVMQSLDSGNLRDLPVIFPTGLTTTEVQILSWINGNLMGQPIRAFSSKQLFLHGRTSLGKTSLLMLLAKFFRIFWTPMDEDFYDGYSDKDYDLIVMDEFKAQKKITWLNGFVQGSPHKLRIKGGQIMKRKNLPVIVTSNYSIAGCYHKAAELGSVALTALERRFEEVELTTNIFSLLDRLEAQ